MRFVNNKKLLSVLFVTMLIISISGFALAKSLYLAANHHTSAFDAWSINPSGTILKQAAYSLHYATDPSGITMDEDSKVIFITSEFSGGVEMVNPVTLEYIGVSSGPSDLAGIDVDDVDDIVYSARRWSNRLYIYLWDETSKTMTFDSLVYLPNCGGAFGIALDEITDVLWVADSVTGYARAYDVNPSSLSYMSEITILTFKPVHKPVDIAVDRNRGFVYTVSLDYAAYTPPGTGSNLLSKYDLATGNETTVDLGCQGVGVTVDEASGYVYVTVSPYCTGWPYQGQIQCWDTSTSPWSLIDAAFTSGSPAGITTGNISYNPLLLAKNDLIVGEVYIGSYFTYEITYENPNAFDVTDVTIIDTLPIELDFISASGSGLYDLGSHTVTWNIGTIPAGSAPMSFDLEVKVNRNANPGSTLYNYCSIFAAEVSPTTVIDDEGSGDPNDEPGTPIGESIPVAVDIKPQSCPNPFNMEQISKDASIPSVLPVAILGTDEFDATEVDPATVTLAGVSPIRWAVEDVATPYEPYWGKEDCLDCTTDGSDGFMDFTLKFYTYEIAAALGEVSNKDCIVLELTGYTTQGIPFIGEDVVRIIKKK